MSPSRTVVLSDCAATRGRTVCFDISVNETQSNDVVVTLQICNNTHHPIALRKYNLQDAGGFALIRDDFERVYFSSGREMQTTGPEDYVVLKANTSILHSTHFERSCFQRTRYVTVKKSIAGYLGDMREPVRFEIAAT